MTNAETAFSGGSPSWRQALVRGLVGALAVLAVSALGLLLAVRVVVDAHFLERRLNTALDEATDGQYRATIDAVQWGLLARSLRVTGITFQPDSQAASGDSEARLLHASVPKIRLTGLHRWALLWNRHLILDGATAHEPRLRIRKGRVPARKAPAPSESRDPGRSSPPTVRVHRVRVEDGTFTRGQQGEPPTDSLWGFSTRFDTLSADSAVGRSPREYLAEQVLEGTFDGFRRAVTGTAYILRVGAGRVSQVDSVLRVEEAHVEPSVSDEAFAERHTYRVNRFRTRVREVEALGVDYPRLIKEGALHAATVRVDAFELDVYRDNHRPERPDDPPPPMPQDAFSRINRSLRIDTLRVRDSKIRYTKRPDGVPQTGTIWFDNLWASVYNVTNDPERMTPSTPMVVEARTQVNGVGRLRASFRIPLLAPHLALSFEGRLGAMDAKPLNETFVPLGGVRIESGQVDSLWFQADVTKGRAKGSVGAVYRNLEVETLDKATGDRGLGDRLKTVATGLALRSNNLPDTGDLQTGRIQHQHDPEHSFFKFLWQALRDGIYSLVGIDRLPR